MHTKSVLWRSDWYAMERTTVGNRLVRISLSALICAVFISGLITTTAVRPRDRAAPAREGDEALFASFVEDLRQGTPYYTGMGAELRARGYPSRSVFNWRTPLHLEAVAALGIPSAHIVIRALAVILVAMAAWSLSVYGVETALRAAFSALGAAAPLLLGFPGPVVFGEAWCGALIGLSLAWYTRRYWTAAAICGVAAVFLRELAAPYAIVCGLLALHARRRREFAVWLAGGAAYLVYFGVHAWVAQMAMRADDLAHAQSWIRWQGLAFVFETASWYGWSMVAPKILVPLLVAAGLTGTTAPSMPPQLRAAILCYVLTFAIVGQPFNSYWGLVTAPMWAFGIMYSADGARWLSGRATRMRVILDSRAPQAIEEAPNPQVFAAQE